jgi:hypothetical protein
MITQTCVTPNTYDSNWAINSGYGLLYQQYGADPALPNDTLYFVRANFTAPQSTSDAYLSA